MDILVKVLQLILSLSILVLFHEFGHFLFAKLFKTRVEKFYMFFNPWFSLFKFKKGETEYGIGWLPLGGYVKIAGMIDESMDTEQMKNPPQPWEFRAKPAWQRLLIMLGGVMVNVVLAFVIFILVLYAWGETYLPADNVKYGVTSELIFKDMGIRNGDKIVALDGQRVNDFFNIVPDILLNDPKSIEVEREGKRIILPVPESLVAELVRISSVKNFRAASLLAPRQLMDSTVVKEFAEYSAAYDAGVRAGDRILTINGIHSRFYDEFTGVLDSLKGKNIELALLRGKDTLQIPMELGYDGKLGIYFANTDRLEFAVRKYSLGAAIPAGIKKGVATLKSYVKQLKLLFTPQVKAYKSVGGVMSMGNIFPGVWDWQVFWELTAFISIMLAVVNILPIPALDGGHVLFLLYEVITRRKPGEKFLEYAQVIGMIFLIALFILVNVNDVVRFFG
ncbi:MAG: RIP metalloprotease RseP [Oscillibacter sp.]|nr:RIP metalloprotease RseP [Oscillibacter sp.]